MPDPESPLLEAALRDLGIDAVTRPWGDTHRRGRRSPLVAVRSTWDYVSAHADFLAWARSVAEVTQLTNPVDVIEWNAHKSYLLDLARRRRADRCHRTGSTPSVGRRASGRVGHLRRTRS